MHRSAVQSRSVADNAAAATAAHTWLRCLHTVTHTHTPTHAHTRSQHPQIAATTSWAFLPLLRPPLPAHLRAAANTAAAGTDSAASAQTEGRRRFNAVFSGSDVHALSLMYPIDVEDDTVRYSPAEPKFVKPPPTAARQSNSSSKSDVLRRRVHLSQCWPQPQSSTG